MNTNQNNQQIEQPKGEGGKLNIPLVVVSIIAITLCILSIVLKTKMDKQKNDYEQKVSTKDTELTKTRETLTEVREEHNVLMQIHEKKSNEIIEISNVLNQTKKELLETKEIADKKEKALLEAEAKIKQLTNENIKLQKEIGVLSNNVNTLAGERDGLTEQMSKLTNSIKNLENQIVDVQKKLANSEGEREFLMKELKRLQAEKTELERQLNDLAFLKEQVAKLKAELSVARRLEWIRKGLYGDAKGAELLMTGNKPKPQQPKTNYNIQAEIKTDGTLKVQPGSTNAPQPAPKN